MQGSYLHSNKKLSIIVAEYNLEGLIGKFLENVMNVS